MKNVVSCLPPGLELDRAVQGLLGAAERLARELGGQHISVVAGGGEDSSLVSHVALHCDRVIVAGYPRLDADRPELGLAVLEAGSAGLEAGAILLGNDSYSQELTPRLAHRLGGSSVGDARELEVKNGRVTVRRSVYGGKAIAVVQLCRSPAVVWLRARAFEPEAPRSAAAPVEALEVALRDGATGNIDATRIVERHREAEDGVRLEDARVIVSGGRGLGGPEPFQDLRKLAATMGAQVGASRAACDAGWVPPSLQVGQTGKKVAPELYLAVAISGASQHLMGIADARVVAAINTDPDAPIFRHCRFGLNEDYRKVIGPLRERIASLRHESG